MPKPYYSDYISHMLRFYIFNKELIIFRNDVDNENWQSVQSVIEKLSEFQKSLIDDVFGRAGSFASIVPKVAVNRQISETEIWQIINHIQKKIAKKRGLI